MGIKRKWNSRFLLTLCVFNLLKVQCKIVVFAIAGIVLSQISQEKARFASNRA